MSVVSCETRLGAWRPAGGKGQAEGAPGVRLEGCCCRTVPVRLELSWNACMGSLTTEVCTSILAGGLRRRAGCGWSAAL